MRHSLWPKPLDEVRFYFDRVCRRLHCEHGWVSLDETGPSLASMKSSPTFMMYSAVTQRSSRKIWLLISSMGYSKYGSRVTGSSHANSSCQSSHVQESDTDYYLESEIDAEYVHEVVAYLEGNRTCHCLNIMMYHKDRRELAPIIYRIARDYLAIPAMSAPSEALFSRVTDIVTKKRNQLHPRTIKMLAILKSRDIVTDESDISDLTNVFEKVRLGEEITGREINDASDEDVATEDDEMTL